MDWLNYHHLRYFHVVAREGSIARASRQLHVSQPSISTQLRQLEKAFGSKLFAKVGRNRVPTEMGRLVQVYAEQIFALGSELLDAVRDRPTAQPLRLQVGIADAIPKAVAWRLLQPVRQLGEPVRILVRESAPERLLADLAIHHLDLLLLDAPPPPARRVRTFHHALGQSAVGVFAPKQLAGHLRRDFPRSLHGGSCLLPLDDSELRRDVEHWLRERDIRPHIVGEFEDSALLETFAREGSGFAFLPTAVASDLKQQAALLPCGTLDGVHARYFAITVERRVRHPAVAAVIEAARNALLDDAGAA